jgi:hypothetical protein
VSAGRSDDQGDATEAAREALRFGFEEVGLGEIVSFTVFAERPLAASDGVHRSEPRGLPEIEQ